MKSPSEKTDSSSIPDTNYQMNTERRSSWQGQYQFSRPPHPGQYPGPDGQTPPRPPYFPEKQEMYATPPNYAQSPSTDPNQWQGAPPLSGGMDRYSQPSPAHSTSSQYSMDHREIPNSAASANGMSAAAAAAAAAMAAAAHTAKASPGYQKPQNPGLPPPNAMHAKPMPLPVQRGMMPFHPNYANVQLTGAPAPNVPPVPQEPGMPNHSSPYQPSPGPPQMNRGAGGPQYPQWGPQQPPNSMDYRSGYQQSYDSQMQGTERMSFPDNMPHGPMSNASSHDSEESRPKSSARSSSQKLSALYEPEEPGRREFIDRVLRYWEEKELPLKHAPMMGGRTLDLYVLYQHVKKKGCMQEVTRSKEWSEISSAMNLGNTSAAGFTLKKQYCKYLYGYECHFERGEPEPQEALARVLEANRKKKQIAEQNQAKLAENSHHDMKPGEDHPHIMPQHHPYPGQHHESPYRPPHPGGLPYHQQMPNMHHPGYGPPGHNHSVPHGPPSSGPYEQQPGYPPMNVAWQQGGPHYQPHRPPPPGQPRYSYRTNGMPQNSGQHYLQQANSVDLGQGMPPRPRFEQAAMPSRPPMPSQMVVPPEVKHPPQPNHNMNSSEPTVPVNAAEIQNAVPSVNNDSKPDQKVQDSIISTSAVVTIPPAASTETTLANSNVTRALPVAATQNDKPDVPTEQSTAMPTMTSTAPTLTETVTPVVNKLPQELQMPPVGPPKPATPQPNAQRNTPTNPEIVVPPKVNYMRSPEPPKPNAVLSPNYKPQPDHIPGPPQQMNSHFRGPTPRPYPPNSSNMASDGFQHSGPYHRPPERAMAPGMYPNQPQYHQSYPQYHGVNQQSTENAYYGQKRIHHSMDQYGPRNKIPRPDPNMFNAMQFRDNYDLHRRLSRPIHHRNDSSGMPHHYPPYNAPGMVQQPPPGIRHYQPTPSHQHPSFPHTPRHLHSPRPRSNSPSVPISMHLSESQKPRPHLPPQVESASKYLQGLVSSPHSRPHQGGHAVPSSPYPVGSVEAVVPSLSKLKEKTAQNIGVVEAWQIILSLKSGLLAESTWALNALSVLLHDERTIRQILLSQLPGLLQTIIEHYRFCLRQLFGICDKKKLKKAAAKNKVFNNDLDGTSATAEKTTSEILSKCKGSPTQLTMGGKQLKYLPAPQRLQNPHSKLPVKVVEGENHFSLLLNTLWDEEDQKLGTTDALPIIGLKVNSTEGPAVDFGTVDSLDYSEAKTDKESIAELTFEDMLSIPSFIRCFAQDHIVSLEHEEEDEKDFDIFPKVKKEQSSPVTNKVNHEAELGDHNDSGDNLSKDENDISMRSPVEEMVPNILQHENEDADSKDPSSNDHASHVQSCLGRFIWSCDVALLEEEAAGFPGNSGFKAPSGLNSWRLITRGLEYIFPKKPNNKEPELILRILCMSNLIRSLSCAHANHNELYMHPDFFETLSGTLLLGHKHRIRHVKSWKGFPPTGTKTNNTETMKSAESLTDMNCPNYNLNTSALSSHNSLEAKEIDDKRSLKEAITDQMVKNAVLTCKTDSDTKASKYSCPNTTSKDLPQSKEVKRCQESGTNEKSDGHCSIFAPKPSMTFSSTVLNENLSSQDDDNVYHDPWWWECVRQVREDSLVTLANLATYLDISLLSNDAMLAIMDALLHWAVCSSADAQDPFPSSNPRTVLSAQSLSIEVLTKLSMKEGNVDLILATRPYTRLEKLFKKLTIMVGNRKDQILREFSIVLLSNLCNEETAARAIALQTGAVSNLLSFLEECEETGLNNQRMFSAGQELVNCGTVSYMMQRCAVTLLKLAKLEENRPLFLKHHLRLLSLSMSSLLGRTVLPLISAVLFELSREPPNR